MLNRLNRSQIYVFWVAVCVILLAGGGTPALSAGQFELVDNMSVIEREGRVFQDHLFHGNHSLGVDRLSMLKAMLVKRFGPRLQGKRIVVDQFWVLEAVGRLKNDEPYWATLVVDIDIEIDNQGFGSDIVQLQLEKQDSKATKLTLTRVYTMAIDKLLDDMEKHWKP